MAEEDDKEEKLYRVDTVPPPAGESDAYNAPTKVGPMAASIVAEMMHAAAEREGAREEGAPKSASPATAPPPKKPAPPRPAATPATPSPALDAGALVDADVPRVYDAYENTDDEDKAATLVSPLAKAPSLEGLAPPPVPVFEQQPLPTTVPPPFASPSAAAATLDSSPPRRAWIDYLLILVIVIAAGGAIYILRR